MNLIKSGLHRILLLIVAAGGLFACQRSSSSEGDTAADTGDPLFVLLPAEKTHVDFSNNLSEGLNTNVLMYEYFYNGGGVAVGDLNGDGLDDVYFTGNMVPNKLYLNKGKMQFEDVTAAAGVAGREEGWKTGVTMADVNGDGQLDIYVCYSGNYPPEKRKNQLFINQGPNPQGVPQFAEQAEQYGLGSEGTSTQASFFDYDKDGDLDMFLLNHNPKSLPILNEMGTAEMLRQDDPNHGVRLFRNDNMKFKDVTRAAGIQGSALSYGLGAGIADINSDGWLDVYVSNDYTIPDYLYINNRNGTFSDQVKTSMGHTSHFSMGNDVADINNDARPDIMTLDMLPEENRRQKLLMAPDNYEKFDLNLRLGFNHQYMRNMLHINDGNGSFREVGQLAGVSNTDWSWAPLFADFDNNGWKDLYITNGYLRDYTNMDFLKYMSDYIQNKQGGIQRRDILELVYQIPSSNLTNYAYQNGRDLTFKNVTRQWGLDKASNSNGAAYTDLDRDGDLDLVVNNVNAAAFIYENQADKQLKHHYLKVKTQGSGANTYGIGAQVTLYSQGNQQYLEQMPTRGYQSNVSPVLHFGLGEVAVIDSLRVVWPNGKQQLLPNVKADQMLTLSEKDATQPYRRANTGPALFQEVKAPISYTDATLPVNDFYRQPLLVNPVSFAGPVLAKADVNGDGLEDLFVGGGKGKANALFIQQKGGSFTQKSTSAFDADQQQHATDATFLDANGDGAPDLYVGNGGYADYEPEDQRLQDRLYLNDGKGGYTLSAGALPAMLTSTGAVTVGDFSGDGKPDVVVGGRVVPGQYPTVPRSYLLVNDGKGNFRDMTANLAPQLQKIGMVTDAAATDLNGDRKPDLVLVGEWMPVTVLINSGGKLADKTTDYFDKSYSGWWNSLLVEDLNGDGKADLVVGNQGLNSQVRASDQEPASLYAKDFDKNGKIDPILSFYVQGKNYPYITRDELVGQISGMGGRYPDYKSYADVTLDDLFSQSELQDALHMQANYLKSACFMSTAGGKYQLAELPLEVQLSPVFAITTLDYDQDGRKDLLLGGNISQGRLRLGKFDANHGVLLKGNGKGQFTYIPQLESGFRLTGDVRSILPVGDKLLFGINQQGVKAYQVRKSNILQ
ncbi:VCBS repeat-containing protein [Telluribacter humicola]|uniref:VCBS repeat-containing protein n=1 Tax=Telluribacter humicola TaxID=1720261 RepID=UPI001A95E62E|nr:VCBS repeat-containing protein [Telluribacter humicola]